MKKVIVEYNEATSSVHFPDGTQHCVTFGNDLPEAPDNDLLSLIKAGLSADDLINLKKADLL